MLSSILTLDVENVLLIRAWYKNGGSEIFVMSLPVGHLTKDQEELTFITDWRRCG